MANVIDCMHLGRDRVIGAWQVRPGVIVDPGPESCIDSLLAGLDADPTALCLTHIHLDHAGASGALVRRFPDLKVYVHEVGAPHVIDPSRLLSSAERLYGADMERLWGEVVPVPEANVTVLKGGEEVEGMEVHYAPGHARHHVAYLDRSTGDAYTGDVAGCMIPPSGLIAAPTPPPEIEVDVWLESLQMLRELGPSRICVTHFGASDDPEHQISSVETWLHEAAAAAEAGDRDAFADWLERRFDAEGPEIAPRLKQAMPPDQLWLGLERYWRKKREAEAG